MTYTVGIDCGSAACKGILFAGGEIHAKKALPTSWSPRETSREVMQALLDAKSLNREEITVAVTGYGRVSVDFADKKITEITCHANGADFLLPGVKTVIDIGGQDSKAISIKDGNVLDFQMNDKCAAGTGRFLEMSANRMGVDLTDLPKLLEADESVPLTSTCAVFADSEIISLLAAGNSREEVAGGVVNLVASRAVALAARITVEPPILLTGGLAGLEGLHKALENEIGCKIEAHSLSRYAGAIGAARLIA